MKINKIKELMRQSETRKHDLKVALNREKATITKLKKDYEKILVKSSHDTGYVLGIIFMIAGLIGVPMLLMNSLDGKQNEGFMLFLENIAFFTFIPGGCIGYYIGTFWGVILNALLDAPYKKKADEYFSKERSVNKTILELNKKFTAETELYKELSVEYEYAKKYDIEINTIEDMARKLIILKSECGNSQLVKEEIKELDSKMRIASAAEKNSIFAYMYEWLECNFWEDKYDISSVMFELLLLSAKEGYELAQENISLVLEEIKNCVEQETHSTYCHGGYFDKRFKQLKIMADLGEERAKEILTMANKKYKEISVPKVFASDVARRIEENEKAQKRPEYDVEIVYVPDVSDC